MKQTIEISLAEYGSKFPLMSWTEYIKKHVNQEYTTTSVGAPMPFKEQENYDTMVGKRYLQSKLIKI